MFYSFFIEPFENTFMLNALLCVIFIGISTAMLGVYVLLRKSVFITSALAHTLLPGIVVSAILGISLYWGAFASALLTAVGVGVLSNFKKVREDTAIGVVLSFMFALGILLMSRTQSFRDFSSLLFGSIIGVSEFDIWIAGGVLFLVILFFLVFNRRLELASFDKEYAELIGIAPGFLQILFLSFVSIAAVSSVRIIGALLTTALLVIPAATASLLARNILKMMLIAMIVAVFSGVLGLCLSYNIDAIPAGAAIVIVASIVFFSSWIIKKISLRA